MICKKCGYQNSSDGRFCQYCGAPLTPPKRSGGILALSVAVGIALIALAVLIFLMLRGASSIQGVWHNEELQQVLRFHGDGTVVIRSPYGDFEADYLLEKGGKKGVITLNGTAIEFVLKDDGLLLSSGGESTRFDPGDMEISQYTPTPAATTPAADSPVPEAAPTPSAVTPTLAPVITATPTPTPAPTPTAAPTATSTSSVTFGPLPSFTFGPLITLAPSVIRPDLSGILSSDIIGKLVTQKVVGNWLYTEDNDYVLTFGNTGDYTVSYHGLGLAGTYTFSNVTGEGELHYGSDTIPFTVSGDSLTWDDGTAFVRE